MSDTFKINYSLKDCEIIPSMYSDIEHRSECNTRYKDGKLPVFVSPMTCLINKDNYDTFERAGVHPIIPRGNLSFEERYIELTDKRRWVAFSLDEAFDLAHLIEITEHLDYRICIDIASGNMRKLFRAVDALKIADPNCIIMTGNVINENTYFEYAMHGVDYIRVGVGGGSVCTTSVGSGIHKGGASALRDMYESKLSCERNNTEVEYDDEEDMEYEYVNTYKSLPKIIADGGITGTADINIALALGADYVMLGEMIAETEEACGEILTKQVMDYDKMSLSMSYVPTKEVRYRIYYGMSTKRAQKEMGKSEDELRESQGIEKEVPITTTIDKLVAKIDYWLREAMSETNCKKLNYYIGRVRVEVHTPTEYNCYHKDQMDV